MEVYNKELGITDKDITSCNDRDKLLYWKAAINLQVAKLKSRILDAKAAYRKGTLSEDNLVKISDSKRYANYLVNLINNRLTKLKSNQGDMIAQLRQLKLQSGSKKYKEGVEASIRVILKSLR